MTARGFSSYDQNGRIIATGIATNPHEQVSETGGVLAGAMLDGNLWWVDGEIPALRPPAPDITIDKTSIRADGEEEVLVSGVPTGATVTFGGASIIADGDPIILTTDVTGPNTIIVDPFPAQSWEGGFDGTAD